MQERRSDYVEQKLPVERKRLKLRAWLNREHAESASVDRAIKETGLWMFDLWENVSKEQCTWERGKTRSSNAKAKRAATNEKWMEERRIQKEKTEQRQRTFDENIEITDGSGGHWDFGGMDIDCIQYGTLHYKVERAKRNTRENPVFADSCNNEKVNFALHRDLPQYLRDFFTGCGSQARHSTSNIQC